MVLSLAGVGVTFAQGAKRSSNSGAQVVALDDVSFTVPDGAIVGVIGPNGAGKTTLFNVICGVVRPARGTVTLDGAPLQARPDQLTRLGIARTLQGPDLFDSCSVLENVMAGILPPRKGRAASLFGLPSASRDDRAARERARAMLDELRLGPYGDQLPATLPHATRRLVSLARALVSDPRLLLLDEPASGLSGSEVDRLAELILKLPGRKGGGRSVLLVEHNVDLVLRVCDHVIVLDLGRVIAAGPPATVRDDPVVIRAYLGDGS